MSYVIGPRVSLASRCLERAKGDECGRWKILQGHARMHANTRVRHTIRSNKPQYIHRSVCASNCVAVCSMYTTLHYIPFHSTLHSTLITLHINITHYNIIHFAVPYITICYHTTSHMVTMYNSTLPYITSHCHTTDRHTYIHTYIHTYMHMHIALHCSAALRCSAVQCSARQGMAFIHACMTLYLRN